MRFFETDVISHQNTRGYFRPHSLPPKLDIICGRSESGQYVILPFSTNSTMVFGRIMKLLCDEKFAYFQYRETSSYYDEKTDLHIITDNDEVDVIASHHLSDYRSIPVQSCIF